MVGGNCLYSPASLRLIGNNSLIYTLKTWASIELTLNCEFCSRHPVLIDVYNSGKTALGEKLFTSLYFVFELTRLFRPFEIGNKNRDLVALVKNDAKLTCTDKVCIINNHFDLVTK